MKRSDRPGWIRCPVWISRFEVRFRWGLLAGLMAIALATCQTPATESSPPMTPSNVSALDEQIRALRTGELLIKVVDATGQPVENATVHLQQTSHHFEFGVSLRTEMFADSLDSNPQESNNQTQYLNIARSLFNASVPEDALKWYSTESVPGQVSYADADRILAWSEQNHQKMRGHHLFWAVERWNQDWLKALSTDQLRTAVQNRATEMCDRYRGRIPEYDVLNEILNGDFFQQRLGEGIVKEMFLWCHAADPSARLYTNEYNILNGEQRDRYIELVRSLIAQGVPLGGIGVQAHIRQDITADQIQHNLDSLAELGIPIKITEFSAVAETDAEQAQMLSSLYRVAFAHPAVDGIYMWGFWEGSNWEPRSAIFHQNFEPKLAAEVYRDLIYRQWWTDETAPTNVNGEYSTRAFFGTYQLSAESGELAGSQSFSVNPNGPLPKQLTLALTAPG